MTVDRIVIDYRPRKWQAECHRKRRRFSVYAIHRRAGKTEMALAELVDKALKCSHPLPLFAYLAPFLSQARGIAWARLKAKVEPLRRRSAVDIREADLAIVFAHNGAVIRLWGADNPDALRGVRLDGCVIDEVAQIKPEVWTDILQPALSDRLGWAMFIGTPNGINLFSELYFGASGKADWNAARYTVDDTEAIDPAEVARLRADMPEGSFAREYLCDFSAGGVDQLLSLQEVEDAARRSYTERDVAHAATVLGVDPARFGDDRSVIIMRRGLVAFPPIVHRGVDNMKLADIVASQMVAHSPDAVFVDAGSGSGVIDRLRQLGHGRIIEVPFGGKALASHLFDKRRSEMWCEMATWLRGGGAIPNDVHLKTELATPTYWFDSAGRKVLESKDDIKARLKGGASPDIADALALTFAAPVSKVTFEDLPLRPQRKSRDAFNPFRPAKR